jgi:hypothetical protein
MGHPAIVQMLMDKGAKLDMVDQVSELLTYYTRASHIIIVPFAGGFHIYMMDECSMGGQRSCWRHTGVALRSWRC